MVKAWNEQKKNSLCIGKIYQRQKPLLTTDSENSHPYIFKNRKPYNYTESWYVIQNTVQNEWQFAV